MKVDDVLHAQKDEAVAGMIGAELEIDEAMILREAVGRVSVVTWSKVQGSLSTLKTTQAYALRQLDALADKMEKRSRVGDLAETFVDAEGTLEEWLAVIARCFQLQDGMQFLSWIACSTHRPRNSTTTAEASPSRVRNDSMSSARPLADCYGAWM